MLAADLTKLALTSALAVLGTAVIVGVGALLAVRARRRLLRKGERADAYVRSAKPLWPKHRMRRRYRFELEVAQETDRYPVVITSVVDRTAAPWSAPGRVVAVRVDPRRPERIAIDWPQTVVGQRPTRPRAVPPT
jgi:hypothetical protein